jgi:hypothetical protein
MHSFCCNPAQPHLSFTGICFGLLLQTKLYSMKKLMAGLIMLIVSVSAVHAQHTEFGLKIGYNGANFTDAEANDYKMYSSFHAGGLAHIHLNKTFALQPEILYSGQGTKFAVNNTDFRYHLSYINVPVLLQFMTTSGFRLETGPQIGFLLSASAKSGSASTDIKSSFKSTDFSWAFGAGYITPSGFGLDARYNLGLSDISDAASSTVKNSVIQVGVFYQFKK